MAWIDKEYSTPKYQLSRGTFVKDLWVKPPFKATVTDQDIRKMISELVRRKILSTNPTGNALTLVYFPPGVTVLDGQERSCINFCTYHGKFTLNKRTQYYAVIPDQDCASAPVAKRRDCKFGLPLLDATTAAISNVYVGAKTDPDNGPDSNKVVPRFGWVDRFSGEI